MLDMYASSTIDNISRIGVGLGWKLAGQKIGISDESRFIDKMSFDEATRYNHYWDNVELKVQNNGQIADNTDAALKRTLEKDGSI